MNIIEQAAYLLGKSKGFVQKGLADVFSTGGTRPSLDDPSAWGDSYRWGEGLLGNRPKTKADFVRQFQGWVYIATKLNAQSVASVPLRLYVAKQEKGKKFKTITTRAVSKDRLKYLESNSGVERYLTKSEEIEEVTEHSFIDLMNSVNPYQNKRDLLEMTTMNLDLAGEAYWFLIPDKLGVPTEIYVIPAQFINPKFGKTLDKAIEGYVYESGNTKVILPPEHVIYFAYPNPNNIFTGFSSVRGIAETIYIQNEMDGFEAALFENKARIGGVITQKEHVGEQDKNRLKEQYQQTHTGGRKAGKTMWLPKGLEYTRDTMTPEELNFIEGRRWTMEMICLAFDIPPGALMSKDVNLANADVADYRHSKNGILPRCRRIEEKLNEKLISLYDERLFCAFDNPVPENKEFRLKENAEYLRVGAISRDEVRSEIGKDVRGGMADELLVDAMLTPITMAGERQVDQVVERAKEKLRRFLD
jgi:HK97 family phage portal protein